MSREKPRRDFKKGIDAEDSRRRREELTIQLRKAARDEQLVKRRMAVSGNSKVTVGGDTAPTPSGATGPAPTGPAAADRARPPEVTEKLKLIPSLVVAINSEDVNRQLEAVVHFRKLLSIERSPPIQEVIDSGVVPRLVRFLSYNHHHPLQFEAAWALTNIASGTTKHTKVVLEHGSVPLFIELLRSPNEEVREQAVWALGNIAGDSHQCRDLVLKSNVMEPLLALCNNNAKLTMLRNATWTISNLCRGKPQPPFDIVCHALPTLANLLYYKDDEVLTDACWALSYLSDDTGPHNQKIQAVVQSGVCRRLVELLMHKSPTVKTPALRTVGNIVTGDDLQTQVIIQCSALPCLLALLVNPKKGIRKEACWTISNITAGNHDQIQAVIDSNIIPPLVAILRSSEFDIQKEAAWAISNATSGGTDEQIRYLVSQAVIPPLCNLFACSDSKIVLVAMEGIENILRVGKKDTTNKHAEYVEECGGVDHLENLQRHENEEIYEKAVKILRDYFESEEEEDPNATNAQATTDDDAQFQFGSKSSGKGYNFD